MKLGDVQFSEHEHVVVARLTGEIDLSNADGIEGAIAEAMLNHVVALEQQAEKNDDGDFSLTADESGTDPTPRRRTQLHRGALARCPSRGASTQTPHSLR